MSLGHFGPAQLQSGDPGTGLGTRREVKNSPKVEASFPEGRGAGLTGPSAAPAQATSSPSDFFPPPVLCLLKTWTLSYPVALWEALNSNCGSPSEPNTYGLSPTRGQHCVPGHLAGHAEQLWWDRGTQTLCQVTTCGRLQWQHPQSGETGRRWQAP